MQDLLDFQIKPAKETNDHNGQPQDRRKAMQKRTFTRWMNLFLQRREPPLQVGDLFTDVQDGRLLMALLEELSGCKLLYRFRSSSHRIFRLNNISKALAFLDDRHVRLLDIDASGIADGVPSVVLNLVWNVILHFQVKEATAGLQSHLSSSLSSLSLSAYPSSGDLSPQTGDSDSYACNTLPKKGKGAARETRYHSKAIKTLLHWVQRCTSKYGVDVEDFGASWRSGLAFLALIKSIKPELVDLRESLTKEPKENVEQSFMLAHQCLNVPPLLEPEDVTCTSPDEQSIITYVSMFLRCHSDTEEDHVERFDCPEIPGFASLEPVGFGGTLVDDPEAQALRRTFEESNEQRLWRRWSRRSSETSKFFNCNSKKGGSFEASFSSTQRPLEPPSPLDTGVANLDIRSWMDRGSDHRRKVYGSQISQSSEEGIYSLSALDSDEEEAYSYILDLSKDVFQPNNPPKRQVLKVEEETAEEMEEESKHLEALGTFNGGRYKEQEGPLRAQSEANRMFVLDQSNSSLKEATANTDVFDLEPEAGRGSREDPGFKRGTNSDGCTEEDGDKKVDSDRKGKDGSDKTHHFGVKARLFQLDNWKYVEKERVELSEKLGRTSERTEGEDFGRLKERQDLREQSGAEEARVEKEETRSQKCVKLPSFNDKTAGKSFPDDAFFRILNTNEATITSTGWKAEAKMGDGGHLIKSSDYVPVQTEDCEKWEPMIKRYEDLKADQETAPERPPEDVYEGDNGWTAACRASSQSFRNHGGFSLQSIAACCNTTPLELEMLLLLWISLYCYLILPQMSL